jgi:hypothetical protein
LVGFGFGVCATGCLLRMNERRRETVAKCENIYHRKAAAHVFFPQEWHCDTT